MSPPITGRSGVLSENKNFLSPPTEAWGIVGNFIYAVTLDESLSKVSCPSVPHGKSPIWPSAEPKWEPLPRVLSAYDSPGQSSIWLAKSGFPAAAYCMWGLHGYADRMGECESHSQRMQGSTRPTSPRLHCAWAHLHLCGTLSWGFVGSGLTVSWGAWSFLVKLPRRPCI